AAAAEFFCNSLSTVPDSDPWRASDTELAGLVDQAAKGLLSPQPAGQCSRPGEKRRDALRCFRGARRISQDVHHNTVGGRKKWQHGRGTQPLHIFPATDPQLPPEASAFPGIPI